MRNLFLYFIVFIVIAISCSNKKTQVEKSNNEHKITNVEQSTSPIEPTKIDTVKFNLFISLFQKRLEDYQDKYNKDTNCINQIPVALLSDVTNEKYDTIYDVSKIYALRYFHKTNKIIALMYKIDCRAGGYCSRYYIATFKLSGVLIDNVQVGVDVGSLEERIKFEYEILSNEHIQITQKTIKYDDVGSVISKETKTKEITITDDGKVNMQE